MCTERVICPWPHTHTHQAGWPFLLVLEQIIFTGRIPVATRWLHQSSRQNSIIPRVFWLNKYISSSTPTNYICPVLTVSINWYIPFSEPSAVFLWRNLVHQSSSQCSFSEFNRRYFFSDRRRVYRYRSVSGGLVNLESLSAKSLECAHRGRDVCVCS
jgi:hypothetical protein